QANPVNPAQANPAAGAAANSWTCACGAVNTGKFCSECGVARPSADWTCGCGAVNTGKFCSECGKPRP
ncbi:MAG: SPFH domain-containing protein, partial [Clostridium sp.]